MTGSVSQLQNFLIDGPIFENAVFSLFFLSGWTCKPKMIISTLNPIIKYFYYF